MAFRGVQSNPPLAVIPGLLHHVVFLEGERMRCNFKFRRLAKIFRPDSNSSGQSRQFGQFYLNPA